MENEKKLSVKERLASLETLTITKWDEHDKRSEEKWGRIEGALTKIDKFMLAQGDRKTECMKEAKAHTHKIVSLALGVPVTISCIIGIFIALHKLFGG